MNQYTHRQLIEQECFNQIVHQKWDAKSLFVEKDKPPFAEYSADLLFAAKKYMAGVTNKKILEIGCGNGELSVWLAKNEAEVWGVDISDESIKIAEKRSRENETNNKTHFFARPAEEIPFPNEFFDIVFINVTLHHLEVEKALFEFKRVLKLDGLLVAIEPFIFSQKIQQFRTSKFFTKLYPIYQETPLERILESNDLKLIEKTFETVEYTPYRIFSPFIFKFKPLFILFSTMCFFREKNKELRKQYMNRRFQKVDEWLLRKIPRLKKLSRYIVIKAVKN